MFTFKERARGVYLCHINQHACRPWTLTYIYAWYHGSIKRLVSVWSGSEALWSSTPYGISCPWILLVLVLLSLFVLHVHCSVKKFSLVFGKNYWSWNNLWIKFKIYIYIFINKKIFLLIISFFFFFRFQFLNFYFNSCIVWRT